MIRLLVAITATALVVAGLVGSLVALWYWALFGMDEPVARAWWITASVSAVAIFALPIAWMEVDR